MRKRITLAGIFLLGYNYGIGIFCNHSFFDRFKIICQIALECHFLFFIIKNDMVDGMPETFLTIIK